jgi:uncharacterized membrane protein YccF (DUF307 family)
LFHFWPFGREAADRRWVTNVEDVGTGTLGFIGNVIWFLLAGIWLALCHFVLGILFCLTIIGIPFGIQHFKIAGLAIAPIGKTVIEI